MGVTGARGITKTKLRLAERFRKRLSVSFGVVSKRDLGVASKSSRYFDLFNVL